MPTFIKSPSIIRAAGNKPKVIEEFFGIVNSGDQRVSIARMKSPPGWIEPGQTPSFAEYTLVLIGSVRVTTRNGETDVNEGEAILAREGEWVQYSTPGANGAEYISVCLPAFSPTSVHRDAE